MLDRLAQPGTVAVITGQQAGLFTGPAYTIYKALHTIRLASWLSENGLPAVPVFWLATEDHDFEEADHAWVFNAAHSPAKVRTRITASGQPVGPLALPSPPVNELKAALEGLPFRDEVVEIVAECYRPGATMGAAFGALLRRLLRPFDILQVDPMLPSFRALAAPALRAYIEAAPELSARVLERGARVGPPLDTTHRSTWRRTRLSPSSSRRGSGLLCAGTARHLPRMGGNSARGNWPIAPNRCPPMPFCGPSCRIPCSRPWPTSAALRKLRIWPSRKRCTGPLLGRMPVAVPRARFHPA